MGTNDRCMCVCMCRDLEGIYWAVVASEGVGDLLLGSFGLSVAGEDHSLLCAHHELGWLVANRHMSSVCVCVWERERERVCVCVCAHHGRFIFHHSSSQSEVWLVASKDQRKGFHWLYQFTNVPPQHLPISRG